MNWIAFDKAVSRSDLPERKSYVLVQCTPNQPGQAPPVAVGYLKFAAGDKDCPYFVVPGVDHAEVIAWCDCLPPDFAAPLWNAESEGSVRAAWDRARAREHQRQP